jgi:GT2 family glycosyltransferase
LTHNVKEKISYSQDSYSYPIHVIHNLSPKGFGENHNQAFGLCNTCFFCVANPDIRINSNPFVSLISEIEEYSAALIAPMVLSPNGSIEDSVRKYPTLISIFRKLFSSKTVPDYPKGELILNPNWVGGMFMLFISQQFKSVGGFDENYFLYYEDVDLCRSLHALGSSIIYSPSTFVIHSARRSSHTNFRYLIWHTKSMLRFFLKWALIRLFRENFK